MDRIGAARAAMARHAWSEAFEHFEAADAATQLGPTELEAYAEAAQWTYHADLWFELSRRVFAGYQAAGNKPRAARVAVWLCYEHMHSREAAVASGWARRAEQLLADVPDCAEHALLHWLLSMRASWAGNDDTALVHVDRAIEGATRAADRDVLSLALLRKARVLVKTGRTGEAMALVDEAMIAAVAGELTPATAGIVYCATIDTCNDTFDYTRSAEWTDATQRWCEATAVAGFPGICRVHKAEILRLRGQWDRAQDEVLRASDELRRFGANIVLGDAFYELGEIRMRMGDLDAAADAYRQAHELGREPMPGLARLWLAQGLAQDAANKLAQVLADIKPTDRLRRAKLLPAQVEIAIAVGDLSGARAAADELAAVARDVATPALEAYSADACGRLFVAHGEAATAIPHLRRAAQLWNELDAPFEAAHSRVQLAEAYRRQGNREAAELELRAARSAFERLGAAHSLRITHAMVAKDSVAPLSATLAATPSDRAAVGAFAVPALGDVIEGKLELLRLIGGGGMGLVFEAKNQRTGRHVALKVLRRDMCGDPDACQRLLQEALACGRIQHPNVVDIYDAGIHGTHPYIVMELLRGESLATRIERERALPVGDAIDIVLQALAGLAAAHRAGIVHRDLKPDNLFLVEAPGGTVVKVVDFGISKLADNASLAETKTGTVVGTPYYMSPEQAAGSKHIDARTDVYAIGAVLFHAITGRPPFLGDNYNALLAMILTTAAPSPRSLRPETPPSVDDAIMRALARDPAARPASADELAEQLRAARRA